MALLYLRFNRFLVLIVGIHLGTLGLYLTFRSSSQNVLALLIERLVGIVFMLASVVAADIYRSKPVHSHTWSSMLQQYVSFKKLLIQHYHLKRKILAPMQDVKTAQAHLLRDILNQRAEVAYGKDFKFSDIKTVEEFLARHPLTTYIHYDSYVSRVVDGERDVMFPGAPQYIVLSSGTTSGKSKRHPKDMKCFGKMSWMYFVYLRTTLFRFRHMSKLQLWHDIRVKPSITKSDLGVPMGAGSGSAYFICPFSASPPEVYTMEKEKTVLYLHSLFGLKEKYVTLFSSLGTPTALIFFKTIQKYWKQLCEDIESGTINQTVDLEPGMRQKLETSLTPDPERADELRKIFRKGTSHFGPLVWPNFAALHAPGTGAFSFATELLKKNFLGGVPLSSGVHISSESLYGLNLHVEDQTKTEYTILPCLNFYEFIPKDCIDKEDPTTVQAHEVEVGGEYEMVVTTWMGLYRYRTGDVVRVSSFTGTTPNYTFSQRSSDCLNKYPEILFTKAVHDAARTWRSGTSLYSYMACMNQHIDDVTGDVSCERCFYIFLELEDDSTLSDEDKEKVDVALQSHFEFYHEIRSTSVFVDPVVIQVKSGTLDVIKQVNCDLNSKAAVQQYKYPKFTTKLELIRILLANKL
ncbi:indole-3-acetic acid-amido synthetase GH3.3-like [Haliotis rubra]|uniref:indole-3-acetic acid-amido synthetase GH3.3-like n=1 Tax=Haliotis rubra TaxID=36100 RepID=UPI001EE5221D|nr:indole-3-acetic acid-amido synthetase GH3.3-like [Haliotis rubra]